MTLPWPSQVKVLVDMARGDGGWRPFPLFHVPCTKEQLPVGNSSVNGVVRSDNFNQAPVPLLSKPSAYEVTGRAVEHGAAVRVLAECVGDRKERFFQVAVLVPRAYTASKWDLIHTYTHTHIQTHTHTHTHTSAHTYSTHT